MKCRTSPGSLSASITRHSVSNLFLKSLLILSFTTISVITYGQCRLLNENFNSNPVLSATNVDGTWYPDRYRPAAFVSDVLAGENVLKISIDGINDGFAARPAAYQSTFYNTQGRKFNQCGKCVTVLKGDLWIPADWATKHRRSDMWATAYDATNAISVYPIIGFRNPDGNSPGIYYWDENVGWVDTGLTITYDTWYHFAFRLNGTNLEYLVNNSVVGTLPSNGSVYFGDIIMQAYNFNDPTLPSGQQSTDSYDAYWDNLVTTGTNGNVVTNSSTGQTFCTIQAAIDAAANNDLILVSAGTYNETVTINKSIHLRGQAGQVDNTFIMPPATLPAASDPLSSIIIVTGSGVNAEVSGLTVKGPGPTSCGSMGRGIFVRDGATANIHDNKILDIRDNAAPVSGCQNGIAIQVGRNAWTTTGTATISNNIITGYQKGAIVVDNTGSSATITGNTITGIGTTAITAQNGIQISRGATATLSGNIVSGNSYHAGTQWDWGACGILLYQSGAVALTGGNVLSGNDNNYNATGVTGALSLGAETFGPLSAAPVTKGYQIVIDGVYNLDASACTFGGVSPSSATLAQLFDIEDRIWHKTDDPASGFVKVNAGNVYLTSTETGAHIQNAIDAASAGDVVHVLAGDYGIEIASNRFIFGTNGPHLFGLFIDKDNLTVKGYDASGNPVTNASGAAVVFQTGSTANFGPSGILIQANGVTLEGLKIGDNIVGGNISSNKTIEVIGDNFTMHNCYINTSANEGALYMGRWDAAHPVNSYTITNNIFNNSLVSINNGVGLSGARTIRQLTGNIFNGVATPYIIGFRGWNGASPAQGWITSPVGGAVVTGNTFNNTGVENYFIARGNEGGYDNSQFNWAEIWNSNTFGNHVVTLSDEANFIPETYTDWGGYQKSRRISPRIQENVDIGQTNDVVLVSAGRFPESVIVNKSLTILGPNANNNPNTGTRVAEAIIHPATSSPFGEIVKVQASNVKINGFTIDGDNPALTPSLLLGTNGATLDAAEAVTVYVDNVNNLTVSNNIIQNLTYYGVTIYGASYSAPATTGHVVSNNLIRNMGTYTDPEPNSSYNMNYWGGGVMLYNQQYAAVTDNVMTNVRIGVQTGNFHIANPGAAAFQVISGNTIQARRRGIFDNLYYGSASPYTISGNTITALANANETAKWDGMLLASMQSTAPAVSGNTISVSGMTIPTTGIAVWNCQVSPVISGGTITGVNYGINVNNYEGYPSEGSNAGNTTALIDGVTINGASLAGIKVQDHPSNSNGATVNAEVKNTAINGSTGAAGILVSGADATAIIYRNTITANGTGVKASTGGKLTSVTENYITNNTTDGIQIVADAGTVGNVETNVLTGNTGKAINNLATATFDATCNWFGTIDQAAVGTRVSGLPAASYIPFLTNGTDADAATPGFQNTSCRTVSTANPTMDYVGLTDLSDNVIDANLIPLNSINRIRFRIQNLDETPGNVIPAGTTTMRIDLGSKLKLDPLAQLNTAPLSTYFSWTVNTTEIPGHDIIYGDQTADIPADFTGIGYFSVKAVQPGTASAFAAFQVTNQSPISFLIDWNPANNNASIDNYVVLNEFTIIKDNQVNVSCYNGTNGSITVHASGGAPPYQYSIDGTTWLPVTPTNSVYTFNGLSAGSYTIQARDVLGQLAALSPVVEITQPAAALTAATTQVNVLCYGNTTGSVNLTVTGGTSPYSYLWSNGATTEDVSALAAGNYSVTVTDANNCTTTASAVITQPVAALAATTSQVNVLCYSNTTGSVNLTVTGGTSPYSYLWSNGATTEDISALAAGNYSVTVTDANNCTTTVSAVITQPTAPVSVIAGPSVVITNISCYGSNNGAIDLTFSAQGGTGTLNYAYTWTKSGGGFSASTEDVSGLAPGSYNVAITVTDANGCTITSGVNSVTITEPSELNATIIAITPSISCAGSASGSVTVSATGGTPGSNPQYQYQLDGGAFQVTGTFTGLTAGSHTVTVKDAKGCQKAVNFTITEPANTDVTLGGVFNSNLFTANVTERTVVYNLFEVAGKAATPVTLRITQPIGYTISFDNTQTLITISGTPFVLDNSKWVLTYNSSGGYYDLTRTGPGGNNTLSCSEGVNVSIKMTRQTNTKSGFNLNAQVRKATSEILLTNNTNSLLFVGQ